MNSSHHRRRERRVSGAPSVEWMGLLERRLKMVGNGSPWRKPDPDLAARFHEAVAGFDGVVVCKMFGFPAVFVGGNMTAGVHPGQNTFMVRLAEDERSERLADGWSPFEPMPGRVMREYVTLPADVALDVVAARHWIERAAAYVRTLPPKKPKAPKAPSVSKS